MRCPLKASRLAQLPLKFAVVALLGAVALAALAGASVAQGRDVATTAVVTFDDKSGMDSPLLEAKATDAVALALQDSQEYLVTPTRDVDRELRALSLSTPLSKVEAVRLGNRLGVDSVTVGEILEARVDETTGKGVVGLQIMMVDVDAGEYLDGATATGQTKVLPGWTGTEADILNEALRETAEDVVANMLATRVPRGTIEVVLQTGSCEINIGSQDGAKEGMKLAVLRPIYLAELEKMTLRKIGRVEVADTHPDICYANPVKGVAPRTGDYVVRIYEPLAVVRESAAKQRRTQFIAGVGALALLLGFAMVGTNGNEISAPPNPISYLHQDAMGAEPVIRIELPTLDRAHGHLLFRGHSAGFPADAPYLVEVSAAPNGIERIKFMDDTRAAQAQQDRTITVNFRDEDGDPDTEDVDCTWTHPALFPGQSYYHKIRRVTKPAFPPGTNPPLSQTGGTDNVAQGTRRPAVALGQLLRRTRGRDIIAQDPTNSIDSGHEFPMVSEPTTVAGPVTYILPVQLLLPENNKQGQGMNSITFEWSPTTGADEYMVEVFDSSDPSGLRQPIFRRSGVRAQGASSISETWQPATGDLQESSVYYWRVGARKSLEAGSKGQGVPQVGFGANVLTGWVLSDMRSFQTTVSPPPPPATAGATAAADEPVVTGAKKTGPRQKTAQARRQGRTRRQAQQQRRRTAAPVGRGFATPFPTKN